MNPSDFFDRYDEVVLTRYLVILKQYAEYIHRVTETVSVDDSVLTRRVTLNLSIPNVTLAHPAVKTFRDRYGPRRFVPRSNVDPEAGIHTSPPQRVNRSLVPLLRARRGRLFSNLDVRDADGTSLAVLNHEENICLAGLLLQAELYRRVDASAPPQIVERVAGVLNNVPALSPKKSKILYNSIFHSRVWDSLPVSATDARYIRRLTKFFCSSFLTTVEVPFGPNDRTVVQYSYTSRYQDIDTNKTGRQRRSIADRVGRSPSSFRVTIPLAFTAKSYHFRMSAPKGYYCNNQELLTISDAQPKRWKPHESGTFWKAVKTGLPYSHIYCRRFHKVKRRPLIVRAVFYERPPGSLGMAVLTSWIVTLMLISFASIVDRLLVHRSGLTAAPFIVAIPGTVALWAQRTLSRHSILVAPLLSRFTFLSSALLALMAALLLIIVQVFNPNGSCVRFMASLSMAIFGLVSLLLSLYVSVRLKNGLRDLRSIDGQ
jgi:hypothetical protein